MNLRELQALIDCLKKESPVDVELVEFYERRRVKLLHAIADKLIKFVT